MVVIICSLVALAATIAAVLALVFRSRRDVTGSKNDDADGIASLVWANSKGGESYIETMKRLDNEARLWRAHVERAERKIEAEDAIKGRVWDDPNFVETDDATTVFVRPQPDPKNGDGPALWPIIADELDELADNDDSDIHALLAKDARARHQQGLAKYGVPLVANNGRDHLIDLYQECLDAIVYARAYDERMEDDDGMSNVLYDRAINVALSVREEILRRDGV